MASNGDDAGGGRSLGDVLEPRVLREYALVADGERGAVIGPDGSVAWLCVPRWDSAAVFSGLLGGPGRYTVGPVDPWYVWGGYYESGSLIWRNRWVGDTRIECREALAMPADPHRAVLLRRIEAIDGTATVTVTLGALNQIAYEDLEDEANPDYDYNDFLTEFVVNETVVNGNITSIVIDFYPRAVGAGDQRGGPSDRLVVG